MAIPKQKVVRIILDTTLFLLVVVLLAALFLTAKPFHRGFFCGDQTITYPFKKDTVPTLALFLGSFVVPIACVLLLQLYRCCEEAKITPRSVLKVLGAFSLNYYYGILVNILLTELGKVSVGRLRPNFWQICGPDVKLINCSSGYIENYSCTNPLGLPDYRLIDAKKSFPSGHASIAVFAAAMVSLHIYRRFHCGHSLLLRSVLQLVLWTLAFFVALSRVADYKHHWSDVLAGSSLGVAVAVWADYCLNPRPDPTAVRLGRSMSYNRSDESVHIPLANVDSSAVLQRNRSWIT